jgi:RNA polymerase sigma-70 factor (ECF subfamily)
MSSIENQDRLELQNLYLDHHGWLVGWLVRRINNTHDACDLAQDVFVRMLGRNVEVGKIVKPRAWLARVAHGLMVDHLRRRDIERAYAESVATLPADLVPSPETHVIVMDALAAIDAMLSGLKPRARTVFLRSRLEGEPYARIATDLGVSLSTVEKDMASAIRLCLKRRQDMPL